MLAAALAALALTAQAPEPSAPGKEPAAPADRLRVRTVSGRIAEVSVTPGRLSIDAAEGRVALSLDRNTVVYLETHQGTVRDLAAGQPVRAAAGAQGQAYWIEILPPAAAPPSKASPRPEAPGPA